STGSPRSSNEWRPIEPCSWWNTISASSRTCRTPSPSWHEARSWPRATIRACRATPRWSRPTWDRGMPETAPLLAVRELHAWYGESHILHGVTFDVRPGAVVTLLASNGEGRTNSLNSIIGLARRPPSASGISLHHILVPPQPHHRTPTHR